MGLKNPLPTNDTAPTKPTSNRSISTASTKPISGRSMSTENITSQSTMNLKYEPHNSDDSSCDSNELSFVRTPPKRMSLTTIDLVFAVVNDVEVEESIRKQVSILEDGTPVKLFKRLSSTGKLQVNWPPVSAGKMTKKKALAKKAMSLTPKPPSTPAEPVAFSTEGSISDTASATTFSSLSDNNSKQSGQKKIGQSLHTQRRGIKEKIDLYEKMCHRSSESCNRRRSSNDFNCDLFPTMKLRSSYLDDTAQPSDHEYAQEVFADVSLSPGHNLPQPTGCRKHRRVSYRIRFGIPDLEKDDDQDTMDCDDEHKDLSTSEAADSRGGGIRGIRGFNRSNDWVSWDESTMDNNKIIKGEDNDDSSDVMNENGENCTVTVTEKELDAKTERNDYEYCCYHRPDVWVTPIKSKDGSQKWIAKRVWDNEDKDDEEPEYEVDHLCLMDGVRGLMGIPEEVGMTSDEWQVNFDESDPWEMAADKDITPAFPMRTRDDCRVPLYVKKVVDVDGQYEKSTRSLLLDEENYRAQIEHFDDKCSLTNSRASSDSDSDASIISLIDYFDGDDSSVSVSLQTQSVDYSYQLPSEGEARDHDKKEGKPFHRNKRWMSHSIKEFNSSLCPEGWNNRLKVSSFESITNKKKENQKIIHHNERGFGRPDEWVRPNDAYGETSKENKHTHHNKRGFGRPEEWIRPNDDIVKSSQPNKNKHHTGRCISRPDEWARPSNCYEKSLDCSNYINHNERGFGRADVWVKPSDSYEKVFTSEKKYHHSKRAFGRPDEWVRPIDGYEGSSECRSCLSPVTSRSAQDKSMRESSPEEYPIQSSKGGFKELPRCTITLDECKTLVEDLLESHNNVRMDCVDDEVGNRRKQKKKKKTKRKERNRTAQEKLSSRVMVSTCSIEHDSEKKYKRGTPTWEKRALQQGEEESNIKLWWE